MPSPTLIAQEQLIEALRLRYDYYSARTMFELGCKEAGLAEAQPAYAADQVRALSLALGKIGDRVGGVLAQLEALIDASSPAGPEVAPAGAGGKGGTTPATPTPTPSPGGPSGPIKATLDSAAAEIFAPPDARPKGRAKRASAAPVGGRTLLVVRDAPSDPELELLVCGDVPALGAWDAAAAVPLSRGEDGWQVELELPAGAEVQFKLLLRRAGAEAVWERGDNRTAIAEPRVECSWQRSS